MTNKPGFVSNKRNSKRKNGRRDLEKERKIQRVKKMKKNMRMNKKRKTYVSPMKSIMIWIAKGKLQAQKKLPRKRVKNLGGMNPTVTPIFHTLH